MIDLEEISKHSQFEESIIQFIRGTTGINFQKNVGIIFKKYYSLKNKTFIMPEPMGGDYKNDGYVVEDAIFYMIYSPLSHVDNITKSMKEKFEGDISGLTKNVYEKSMWGEKIEKAIFLVNNIDKDLPADPYNFFQTTANIYRKKYGVNFELEVESVSDIRDKLKEIPIEELAWIKNQLNISNTVDLNVPNAHDIIDTICFISEQIGNNILSICKNEDYHRISTPKKIEINKLESRENEINAILDKANIVEEVIKIMNQDIEQQSKFETTKNYIINLYKELSKKYSGTELYDMMIEETINSHKCKKALEIPFKFLVVYIFDKCYIFEKEDEKNDIT